MTVALHEGDCLAVIPQLAAAFVVSEKAQMQFHLAGNPVTRHKPKFGERFGKPIIPTPHQTAILRRIAGGYAIRTQVQSPERDAEYHYDDGVPISGTKGEMISDREFERFVSNGWLIGDKDDALFGAPPQIYRARKP